MGDSRNTVQRRLVFQAVQALDHPSADEIYAFICAQHPNVSKGTVYRNLNVLVEKGEILRIPLPTAADRFDSTITGHYHARCRLCGQVSDVDMPYLYNLIGRIHNSRGFLIEDADIVFNGVCEGCVKLHAAASCGEGWGNHE